LVAVPSGASSVAKGLAASAGGSNQESGEEFPSFQVRGTNVSVTGSVIATVTPIDKMSALFKLNFRRQHRIEKPESFKGEETIPDARSGQM
jgi:hypothetical protein